MNLNMFKVKKWGCYFLLGYLPVLMYMLVMLQTYDLILSAFVAIIGIVLAGVLVNIILMRDAFIKMLEGAGLLVGTLDSTGFFQLFTVNVDPPNIRGQYGPKRKVDTVFDRDMVLNLLVPKKGTLVKATMIDENGTPCGTVEVLKMPDPKERQDNMFSMLSRPMFIYNKIIDSFLSKQVLSKQEKEVMIKHAALNLLKKTENLSNNIRDFARYVVEQTRPRMGFLQGRGKWLLIIAAVVIVIILMALIGPSLLSFGSSAGSGGGLHIP